MRAPARLYPLHAAHLFLASLLALLAIHRELDGGNSGGRPPLA